MGMAQQQRRDPLALGPNNPELLTTLAWSVWSRGLPQFGRIPLGVVQAGKPSVGIGLRVSLDLDFRSS